MKFLSLIFFTFVSFTNSQGDSGISTDETLTKYYLWSNANQDQDQELIFDSVESILDSNFNANLPTKVLVHGYTDNGKSSWVIRVKNEFLKQGTQWFENHRKSLIQQCKLKNSNATF